GHAWGRSDHVVFEKYYPARVHPVAGERKGRADGGLRQEGDPLPEQDRDHRQLDRVHLSRLEEGAKKLSATEEPDVPALTLAQRGKVTDEVLPPYRDSRMVLRTEGA